MIYLFPVIGISLSLFMTYIVMMDQPAIAQVYWILDNIRPALLSFIIAVIYSVAGMIGPFVLGAILYNLFV